MSRKMVPTFDTMTRAELIALCVWNDPNGCYTDHDSLVEFDEIASEESLRAVVQHWIDEGDIDESFLAEWIKPYRVGGSAQTGQGSQTAAPEEN